MSTWLVDPVKYFKRFDVNEDGKLSAEELLPALRSLGFNPKPSDITNLFAAADTNGDGFIEYQSEEFIKLLSELDEDDMSNEVLEAFKFLDKDKNGFIAAEELLNLVTSFGTMSEEDTKAMIKMADMDGDGRIDYREFIAMVSQTPKIL